MPSTPLIPSRIDLPNSTIESTTCFPPYPKPFLSPSIMFVPTSDQSIFFKSDNDSRILPIIF